MNAALPDFYVHPETLTLQIERRAESPEALRAEISGLHRLVMFQAFVILVVIACCGALAYQADKRLAALDDYYAAVLASRVAEQLAKRQQPVKPPAGTCKEYTVHMERIAVTHCHRTVYWM